MEIVTYEGQPWVKATMIAAKYGGIELKTRTFPLTGPDPSYAAIHPFLKCPALVIPGKPSVFESTATAKYIASLRPETGLLGPGDLISSARVDAWLSVGATEIFPLAPTVLYPFILPDIFPHDEAAFKKGVASMRKVLKGLNEYLLAATYLVGESISIADITVASFLAPYFAHVIGEDIRSEYPNVMRWYLTIAHQPNVMAVVGEPKLAASTATKPQPKVAKANEEAPKEPSPAAGEPAKPAGKAKHPLDLLPKTPMPLDELKRQYSNSDTRPGFLPWLHANFDAEGYSIFYCNYKYSNELEKTFIAANLISGWFQRLDHLRKYLFGSVHVFGTSGPAGSVGIAGVWIFRGAEIPPEIIADATDGELYEWKKLDLSADKELIEDFLAWDGEFKGGNVFGDKTLAFNQGKTFK